MSPVIFKQQCTTEQESAAAQTGSEETGQTLSIGPHEVRDAIRQRLLVAWTDNWVRHPVDSGNLRVEYVSTIPVELCLLHPWFAQVWEMQFSEEDCSLDKESVLAALEELRHFEKNWNGYQADPINFQVIAAARRFIKSLPDDLITSPQVVPMTRGRLQFEWHRGERSLELEFETPTQVHYLKCDDSRGIEEEQVLPLADRQSILELLRWFMSDSE